ncbi:VOC family protein [Natronomonas sp. CBA1123]|uniref:VOC family protein n=1 Tax=Natronomonas sp. CBA1123 TaxID=2668070 RepID=UPI0012EAB972|nr:VOC family protein [Natronomonas sp. CBA1123]MUV86534.1 VOC family protein [Natronomonas sp. CBA1123]
MDGIVFFRTQRLDEVIEFYTERLGADVWREQPDCTILEVGGFRFGFCERETAETDGILTFVVDSRAAVDQLYAELESVGESPPTYNDRYGIYQCFLTDPEGRTVEIQVFE